jgi:WD40 repeat protein
MAGDSHRSALAIERLHHAPSQDFSWDDSGSSNTDASPVLTCGAVDTEHGHLYLGQSSGGVVLLSLQDLGTHKPRLLGSHGGRVTDICIYPASPVLVASCSADTTIKLWTNEPKALHSTKPLLQTLYGHTAAVTCVAAVHSFLVSGGADGAVLLWKPADSGLLAVPQFQLVVRRINSTRISCKQTSSFKAVYQVLVRAACSNSSRCTMLAADAYVMLCTQLRCWPTVPAGQTIQL